MLDNGSRLLIGLLTVTKLSRNVKIFDPSSSGPEILLFPVGLTPLVDISSSWVPLDAWIVDGSHMGRGCDRIAKYYLSEGLRDKKCLFFKCPDTTGLKDYTSFSLLVLLRLLYCHIRNCMFL